MNRSLLFVIAALFFAAPLHAADQPAANQADRQVQPGVPQGKVTSGVFEESKIFPGTRRDFSVYVPAQYTPEKPAALMVFMDGAGYAKPDGAFRVPVVFDNLIHQKAMPVTIAVFVNPGTVPATKPGAKAKSLGLQPLAIVRGSRMKRLLRRACRGAASAQFASHVEREGTECQPPCTGCALLLWLGH